MEWDTVEQGEYRNRIIIPSFNDSGELNYFVSRTWVKDHPLKYKNPKVSKNIIGFEMFINWDLPIYLVEGVFDVWQSDEKYIPLFGKSIPTALKLKIIEKEVKEVFVILDDDALSDAVVDLKN